MEHIIRLPDSVEEFHNRWPQLFDAVFESGRDAPARPRFDQMSLNAIINKVTMRKRGHFGASPEGPQLKRGKSSTSLALAPSPARASPAGGQDDFMEMFGMFLQMQKMLNGSSERVEVGSRSLGTAGSLEIFRRQRPALPLLGGGPDAAATAGASAGGGGEPAADAAGAEGIAKAEAEEEEEKANAGGGEKAEAAPGLDPKGKSPEEAAALLMVAFDAKKTVKAVKAKAKAKAQAEAKAKAEKEEAEAAAPPKKGGKTKAEVAAPTAAKAEPATVFKGNGCWADEPNRKQITCRFGKGPGSTKAIRYGPGTGIAVKAAIKKGEEWLQQKRAERDRLLKVKK